MIQFWAISFGENPPPQYGIFRETYLKLKSDGVDFFAASADSSSLETAQSAPPLFTPPPSVIFCCKWFWFWFGLVLFCVLFCKIVN